MGKIKPQMKGLWFLNLGGFYMVFFRCKDGTEVELIFNDEGEFVMFGDNVSKEDADKAEEEIHEAVRNFAISLLKERM